MTATRQISVTLPEDMAELIRRKVESGEYVDESAVIEDGLRSLQDREDGVEAWLREAVVPAVQAVDANPSRAIPIDEVEAALEQAYRRAATRKAS